MQKDLSAQLREKYAHRLPCSVLFGTTVLDRVEGTHEGAVPVTDCITNYERHD